MVDESLLSLTEALAHLDGIDLDTVVRTRFAPPVPRTLAVADVASMGVASGVVALDSAAVFRSWDAPKAVSYRGLNGIDNKAGTAVTVQTMVFGNAGGESGAGVASTRNQRLARTSCISTFSSTRRARMWFPGASIWAIRTGCVSCCRPSRHG